MYILIYVYNISKYAGSNSQFIYPCIMPCMGGLSDWKKEPITMFLLFYKEQISPWTKYNRYPFISISSNSDFKKLLLHWIRSLEMNLNTVDLKSFVNLTTENVEVSK